MILNAVKSWKVPLKYKYNVSSMQISLEQLLFISKSKLCLDKFHKKI